MLRRWFRDIRTEGSGPVRESVAIGVGVFIGCLPVFGLHLIACLAIGWLLRLNRLKVYIAANISNPLFAPVLLFAEIQAGAWLRRGIFHPVTVATVRTTNLSVFGYDLIVGSLAVGTVLALVLGGVTYASTRGTPDEMRFLDLARAASDRYVTTSITAWEFARGKLRGDPLYRAVVCGGVLPTGDTLVDIGCGGGLTLALVVEARSWWSGGRWPADWPEPPHFRRMVGIETRPRAAAIAREALGDSAEILAADARSTSMPRCSVALLFDVLHMLPESDQNGLVAAVAAALEPDGVLVVREADATAGWRFNLVRAGNAAKALVFGHWRQRFHYRSPDGWLACFARHGLTGSVIPMSEGTPFGNVLFRVCRSEA